MTYKSKTYVLHFAGLFTQYRPRDSFMTSAAKKVYWNLRGATTESEITTVRNSLLCRAPVYPPCSGHVISRPCPLRNLCVVCGYAESLFFDSAKVFFRYESLVQTRELCSGSVLQEQSAGANSLVCTGLKSLIEKAIMLAK